MQQTRTEQYDVCIVGAGICGLNALFVVSRYLKKGQRVALIDRRERVGGMWVDTYDYVRLHQPHPLFTAGNIKWQWDKDPSHLAAKPEVLDHLQYCFDTISDRISVDTFFGWSYVEHGEADGVVRTTIERDGSQVVLESAKLVKALGFNIQPNDPLTLSSDQVRSVSPDFCDVRSGEIATSDRPVWVIGGGKTAMDTAYALLTARPDREVNLLAGTGTYFWRREEIYPSTRRWRSGTRPNLATERMARRYDGANDEGFFDAYLGGVCTTITPRASNMKLGLISDAEIEKVRSGATQILLDHLVDVEDADDQPFLVLRSGERIPLEPGTWLVNCTGYLLKDTRPYEPYSSASGNVLSINQHSTTLLFTSYAGYYMTHLLMRGKLREAPLFEFDWEALERTSKAATLVALTTLLHNFTVLTEQLPPPVLLASGVDVDRWFPTPRRQWGAITFLRTRRKQRAHYSKALAVARERYGVRCGPLDFSSGNTGPDQLMRT